VTGSRILMYTQDSFGLGHLRRATNLANALVTQQADLSVLMIVDSPVAPFFDLGPNIDFIKLPTVVKIGAGVFRTGRLSVEYDAVRALRSNLIREIVQRFVPDVALVDHMPGGANRELVPTLAMIRRRGLPTKMVLGLRDIIDRPEVTRGVWRREGVYRSMERNYQRVLVYGSPDVFPTAEEYRFGSRMGTRVEYCGYVCNMDPVDDPLRVREKHQLSEQPIVVVMAGGGADGFELMQTYLQAARILGQQRAFQTLMVTGPFMPDLERKALRDRAQELGVQVKTTVGDSMSPINAAHVVVCMAGYNTLLEVLRFGKRAIVVPRPGPSAEQIMRARLFSRCGLVDVLEPEKRGAFELAQALEQALSCPQPVPTRPLDLDGVARASAALLAELPGAARTPTTAPVLAMPAVANGSAPRAAAGRDAIA
jgi:predicted glycosyltransferase